MLRLLLIGLNFLNIFNNYQVIKEVEEKYEEIIYTDEYYIIYNENNQIKLKTNNDEWIRELDVNKNLDIHLVGKDLYIFNYNNGVLKCLVYDIDGKIKVEKQIFDNIVYNLKISFFKERFYITGSIKDRKDELFTDNEYGLKDCFLIRLTEEFYIEDIRIYGGVLNEEFLDICFSDDYIYLSGKKDVLTSGDFGNGGKTNGTIFVVRLDYDLEIINFVVLNDISSLVCLISFKDNIYLNSEDYLYKLDYELENIISNKFKNKAIYMIEASFNKLIVITNSKTYIYDIISLRKLFELDNTIDVKNVRVLKDILYVQSDYNYYFDIACLEGIKYNDPINSFLSPTLNVETIFGISEFIEDISEVVYDPLIYGEYDRNLKYKNTFGMEFIIQKDFRVLMECNVSEGGIYPLGYNLIFTGRAYLNGESIANNYSISSSGNYNLKLIGNNGEEFSVNFIVDSKQINFDEVSICDYHVITHTDEVYYLNLNYKIDFGEIVSVIVDGVEHFDLIISKEDNVLSVKMNPENNEGIKYYIVNSIKYKEDDELIRSISIDRIFTVNVLKNTMKVDVKQKNINDYLFSLDDNNTARFFLVTYIYNNEEYNFKYPLASNKISLDGFDKFTTVYVQLIYDLGDKSYRKIDLMEVSLEGLSAGEFIEIDVLKQEESLKEFMIKVANEKEINKILINNNIVYEKLEKDYYVHIVIGILLLLFFGFGIYNFRYKKYKQKIGLR